jgi:hypothetical protein
LPRPNQPRRPDRFVRYTLRALFAMWIAAFVVVGAYLLAPHLLTLPVPEPADEALIHSVAEQLPPHHGWVALHVLDQDCQCSQRVAEHLLATSRPTGVAERVVWIAGTPDLARVAALEAHGFAVETIAPDQLGERYHLDAAPVLLVVDPTDHVRYLGGYTPRKQAGDMRDEAIIAAVQRGERVPPLPTFGCAVGAALSTTVDPLGIRRWN